MNQVFWQYLLATSLDHYYEQPWVSFFYNHSKLLVIETIIFDISAYCFPGWSKILYDWYTYLGFIQTYYLFWVIVTHYLSRVYVPNQIKRTLVRLRSILGLLLIYQGLRFRWSMLYLDWLIIGVLLVFLVIYWSIVRNASRYFYSNLTAEMKKSLFIYLGIILINQFFYRWL